MAMMGSRAFFVQAKGQTAARMDEVSGGEGGQGRVERTALLEAQQIRLRGQRRELAARTVRGWWSGTHFSGT